MLSKWGQGRHNEGCARFEKLLGNIDGMLWQRAEGGYIEDLVMEIAQGTSVTDADDRGLPWGSAHQTVESGLGVLVKSRGSLVQKQERRL
jgi:hypothetical protein